MHCNNKTEGVEEGENDDFTLVTGIKNMVDVAERINVFVYSLACELDCL